MQTKITNEWQYVKRKIVITDNKKLFYSFHFFEARSISGKKQRRWGGFPSDQFALFSFEFSDLKQLGPQRKPKETQYKEGDPIKNYL